MMQFSDALREVGSFGRFQIILLFVFSPTVMLFGSLSYWTQILILLVPDHRCQIDDHNLTMTTDGRCGLQRPLSSDAMTHLQRAPGAESPFPMTYDPNGSFVQQMSCSQGWQYDLVDLYPTVATQFDWVCSESWKIFTCHSIYWAGSMFGYGAAGFVVDRYGRWLTILTLTLSLSCAFVGTLFPLNFVAFCVARFVAGMSSMPLQTVSYTLMMEYIDPSKRKLSAFLSSVYWLAGAAAFPWVAYLVQDWRLLTIVGLIPSLPLLYLVFRYVPESASWQLLQDDSKRAIETLKRIGEINKRPLSDEFAHKLAMSLEMNSTNQTKSFFKSTLDLVRTRNMRKNTLCLFIAWTLVCMCYHGNNLNQSNLPASVYLIYSLGALLEMPFNFVHLLSVDRLGRRPPTIVALICVGMMGPLLSCLPPESPWAGFILGLLLRAILSIGYNILHQLGAEIFPTVLRGRGICLMRMCGDLGNSVGPFIVSMSAVDPVLPQLLFSCLAVLGAILILFLPETLHQDLPQTVEEGEVFGKNQGICFCPTLADISGIRRDVSTGFDNHIVTIDGDLADKKEAEATLP